MTETERELRHAEVKSQVSRHYGIRSDDPMLGVHVRDDGSALVLLPSGEYVEWIEVAR